MPLQIAKPGIARITKHMVKNEAKTAPPPSVLLHSNENAFGPSPHALAAFRAASADLERYEEDAHGFLAPHLSARYGPDTDAIMIGQGSDDILARIARVYLGPETSLVRLESGYLKVPNYAYANDAEVVSVRGNDLSASIDAMLAAVDGRTRIVYLANPENPAGTCVGADELRRLRAGLPDEALLVIDAAYEEFADVGTPTHEMFAGDPNVVVCRTFSKVFGLAGARIGWATGAPETLDPVRRIGLTFPVSTPALHAARAALQDRAHEAWVIAETRRLRAWLTAELTRLSLQPVPSHANFVLVRFPDTGRSAAEATKALAGQGILIRRFASPIFDDYARITIGHEQELRRAVTALEAFLRQAAA